MGTNKYGILASMEEMDDKVLVQKTLNDPESFRYIIDRYRAKLFRYIGHIGIRDHAQQEDVLQEVFIKVYRNLNGYNDDFPFSSWIYRIAHNEAMNFFRRRKISPLSLESFPFLDFIGEEKTYDEKLLDDEQIKNALNQLDQRYKEVIILKYFEEKSYEEIADILEKPPGTIATLLSRAKQKLKIQLEELLHE